MTETEERGRPRTITDEKLLMTVASATHPHKHPVVSTQRAVEFFNEEYGEDVTQRAMLDRLTEYHNASPPPIMRQLVGDNVAWFLTDYGREILRLLLDDVISDYTEAREYVDMKNRATFDAMGQYMFDLDGRQQVEDI